MTENTMRFGIVGCGVIGPTHAAALATLPDAELVAVTDLHRDRAMELAGKYGARAYADLDEMLAGENLDVVSVCTPSGTHGDIAGRAMRAGRHVLIEKPMEVRAERLDAMIRTAEEQGVKLGVIFQRRFEPAVRRVRGLIQDGAFGRLVLGTTHLLWWRSQAYYDSGGWRGTWALDGGGALMNQGIHGIDLLLWMMGPARSVFAYTDTLAHRMETEDTAVAAIRFANGALGNITATTAAYPGIATRLEIMGDRGSAVIENDRVTFLHLARDETEATGDYGLPSTTTTTPSAAGHAVANPADLAQDAHAAQIADFIAAIREDRPPLVDGLEGSRAVRLVLAIYQSARTGREVSLP